MLDFADFLIKNTPKVWQSLSDPNAPLDPAETALKNAIVNTVLNQTFVNDLNAVPSTFLDKTSYTKNSVLRSLKKVSKKITGINPKTGKKYADDLEAVGVSYDPKTPDKQFPDFLFPLADPVFNLQTNLGSGIVQLTPTDFTDNVNGLKGEALSQRFCRIIYTTFKLLPNTQPLQMPPLASQTPMDMRQGWFIIRCVSMNVRCAARLIRRF